MNSMLIYVHRNTFRLAYTIKPLSAPQRDANGMEFCRWVDGDSRLYADRAVHFYLTDYGDQANLTTIEARKDVQKFGIVC